MHNIFRKAWASFEEFALDTADFLIRGIDFKGSMPRGEYWRGLIGIHLILFLLLPAFFSPGAMRELRAWIGLLFMLMCFISSLSGACRRVRDAGGPWTLPLLPPALCMTFCAWTVVFGAEQSGNMLVAYMLAFAVSMIWNFYWLFKPGGK